MELHQPWDTPNIAAIIIIVAVVVFSVILLDDVLVLAAAGGSHHHKLLLSPETLKFSTDTLIAAVLQGWVHVEILVYYLVLEGGDTSSIG